MVKAKKKLVLLIPQMRHGGAERVVSRLSFLIKELYDVNVVVFDDTNVTYEVGCKLVSINAKPNPSSNFIKKVYNFLKRIYLYTKFKRNNKIDITYSFGDTANLINVLSLGKDKKVISIRGYKRIKIGKTIKDRFVIKHILNYIFNQADSIVSVSELMTKTIVSDFNISSDKVNTIYNGYDVDNIKKQSKEKLTNFQEDFSRNQIIITAGTFRSEKGYWHLLKAFSLVLKEKGNFKLMILGQDYQKNKQKVKKLASELGISDKIIYGGYQSNPFKYFAKSSIYVLSSTFEGFPNALVEAMACGLPVVASDCTTGPREILAPDTNINKTTKSVEMAEYGVIVQRMNSDENYNANIIEECDRNLAKGILKLINDEKLQVNYASKSIERVGDFDYLEWVKYQDKIISQ